MIETIVSFPQSRRYYQNDLAGKQKTLIALHGYGQLAQFFYKKISFLSEDWGILVPEGPHRFYLEGTSGRVGASWMTKEWRAQDIEDNIAYLQQLIEKVRAEHPYTTFHLLGFSQGGATAARLFQRCPELFAQLILWASLFPPDLEKQVFPTEKKLDFVIGKQDPYFDNDNQLKVLHEYVTLGFKTHTFQGLHDLDQQMLLSLLSRN
jgi:predicted esterase